MRWSSIVLAACAVVLFGCGKHGHDGVAEVDGIQISQEEFAGRYRQYLSETNGRDNIVMRKQILNNMINERLIATDVKRRGLDTDSLALKRLDEIRTQALLLGYAQRITLDTMAVTEPELYAEFERYTTRVAARYVYAPTVEGAWNLKDELERGVTFDAIARMTFEDPGLATNGGYLGFFGWGEMEPALEEAAYTLPIGKLSDPVKLRMGYAIIKVEHRIRQPLSTESDFAKARDKLAGAIEQRKIVNILSLAAARVRAALNPVFHEDVLAAFAKELGLDGKLRLTMEHAEVRSAELAGRLLVTFSSESWTVGEAMKKMRETTGRQQRRVKTADDLKEYIVGLAIRDVTLRRAVEQHLDRDTTVREQIARKTLEFTLTRWKESIQDTIGKKGWDDAVLRAKYNEKRSQYVIPEELNVAEILVRTQKEAHAVMRKLRGGADFAALARTTSIRLWAAKQGGELGFGPKSMYGTYGDTLFRMNIGSLVGPLKVDPYFGIFKILGKHESRGKTFDEAKNDIIKEVTAAEQVDAVRRAIDRLRSGASIATRDDIVANIVVN